MTERAKHNLRNIKEPNTSCTRVAQNPRRGLLAHTFSTNAEVNCLAALGTKWIDTATSSIKSYILRDKDVQPSHQTLAYCRHVVKNNRDQNRRQQLKNNLRKRDDANRERKRLFFPRLHTVCNDSCPYMRKRVIVSDKGGPSNVQLTICTNVSGSKPHRRQFSGTVCCIARSTRRNKESSGRRPSRARSMTRAPRREINLGCTADSATAWQ